MKKEIRLVKTCIGLVSEYAIMCLADRATEIALETDITYEEALEVLLKLASVGTENWYEDDNIKYLDFNYYYDNFVVDLTINGYEIAYVCGNNEFIIYKVDKKKFYRKYAANEYCDEFLKEDIEI